MNQHYMTKSNFEHAEQQRAAGAVQWVEFQACSFCHWKLSRQAFFTVSHAETVNLHRLLKALILPRGCDIRS